MSPSEAPKAGLEATVLMSGGIDSAACAHFLQTQGCRVSGIFIEFGQAALEKERIAVRRLGEALDVTINVIEVRAATDFGTGELIGRNAFLLIAAIFLAKVHRGLLAIGMHGGTPYFDCSPAFVSRMKQVAEEHTSGRLTVVAPFLNWHKGQVYDYFLNTGLPLDATYSCESGSIPPCGSCASCRDRRALGC